MSQIKKGALLNYVTIFLTNIIGLVLTPFILNHLGKAEYGVYTTIGALIATISVLDFGLNNTIVRFVAKYRAENDRKGEENFLATTMLIYMCISLIIVIVGVVFYSYIESYFTKMNTDEIRIAKIIFSILIINLAIGLPGGSFAGICFGYESFVFPKLLKIIRYLLRSLVVVALLTMGGGAIAIVIMDTVFNILGIVIIGYFVFKKLNVRIKLHSLSKKFLKQIFGYSMWIFLFSLVGIFQWKVGNWVLGSICPPEVLTIYGIGIMLGTYYGAFSTAISSVFLPRATKMTVGNATGEELTNMMIKIGRISFIVLLYVLLGFILFGNQFVFLWVGKELGVEGSYETWLIALLIMLSYTMPLIQGFGKSVLEAKNKLAFRAILYISFVILGTILGFFLAKKYGALGMIIGTVIGWGVVQNIMNFYYHNIIGLNILRFFKELSHKTILTALLVALIGYAINFMPGENWVNFLIKGISYTIIYIVLMYLLGLIEFEKELFKNTLSPVFKKLKP